MGAPQNQQYVTPTVQYMAQPQPGYQGQPGQPVQQAVAIQITSDSNPVAYINPKHNEYGFLEGCLSSDFPCRPPWWNDNYKHHSDTKPVKPKFGRPCTNQDWTCCGDFLVRSLLSALFLPVSLIISLLGFITLPFVWMFFGATGACKENKPTKTYWENVALNFVNTYSWYCGGCDNAADECCPTLTIPSCFACRSHCNFCGGCCTDAFFLCADCCSSCLCDSCSACGGCCKGTCKTLKCCCCDGCRLDRS